MRAFIRAVFFSIILGAFMSVPASYFFVKDFIQPRVQETLGRIDTINADLQAQKEMLESILLKLNQPN